VLVGVTRCPRRVVLRFRAVRRLESTSWTSAPKRTCASRALWADRHDRQRRASIGVRCNRDARAQVAGPRGQCDCRIHRALREDRRHPPVPPTIRLPGRCRPTEVTGEPHNCVLRSHSRPRAGNLGRGYRRDPLIRSGTRLLQTRSTRPRASLVQRSTRVGAESVRSGGEMSAAAVWATSASSRALAARQISSSVPYRRVEIKPCFWPIRSTLLCSLRMF
jgi:hypothetical protein